MGIIYAILETGQTVYVVQTTKNIKNRFSEHISLAKKHKGFLLHHKMNNHGIENFSIKLLETTEDLDEREKFWIKRLKTHCSQGGYNLTWGGEFRPDAIKVSCCQYDLNGNFLKQYKSITEASRAVNGSIANILKVLHGELRIAYGFRWSYQRLQKLEKIPNNYTGAAKPVYQYDLNGNFIQKFNSTKEAARILQKSQGNISSAANGKRKTAYGYIWSYDYIMKLAGY